MQVTGQVGQTGPVASGVPSTPARQGNYGEAIISELNGKYYEHALRGNAFFAAPAAAVTLSLTGTTTYTGLVLYNPAGSNKNLVIKTVVFTPSIAPTAPGAVMLFSQPYAATIPAGATLLPTSLILNAGANSVARFATAATLASNPVFLRGIMGGSWSTGAGFANTSTKDDIAGEIIVPPGSAIGIVALTTAITGLAYISWDELSSVVL